MGKNLRTVLPVARCIVSASVAAVLLLASAAGASAASYAVNATADAPLSPSNSTTCQTSSAGQCTLRAAVQAASNAGGSSTISLPAGTYGLTDTSTGGTQIAVTNTPSITIAGAGSGTTTIDAKTTDRAFAVPAGAALSLSGLTVADGRDLQSAGATTAVGSAPQGSGGAIYNAGTLTLTNDVSVQNSLSQFGGGIASSGGSLSITGAKFSQNSNGNATSSSSGGGALAVLGSPTSAAVHNSTFTSNTGSTGGAIAAATAAGAPLTIDTSTFTSNTATNGGALALPLSGTVVNVTGSTFSSNSATGGGAVLSTNNALTISTSRFIANVAQGGGAILDIAGSTSAPPLTLNSDEFDTNSATGPAASLPLAGNGGYGGALQAYQSPIVVNASTMVGNHAQVGGGGLAVVAAAMKLTNTTISGNSATSGGGINVTSNTYSTIDNDTVAFNKGGGIYGANQAIVKAGYTGVVNTIVAENSGFDCPTVASSIVGQGSGPFPAASDAGHNLDSDSSCFGGLGVSSDQPGVDPLLLPAADYGGPVLTNAVRYGSPAIDAAAGGTSCPSTDARSVTRPQGTACDLGAFEFRPSALGLTKTAPATATTGQPFNYTLTVSGNGPDTGTGVVVTDQLPAGSSFYGATASQGTCTSSGSLKVTCTIGTLPSGSSATVTLAVAQSQAGSVTNTGGATNDQGSSASASATTQVSAPSSSGSGGSGSAGGSGSTGGSGGSTGSGGSGSTTGSTNSAPNATTGAASGVTRSLATLNGTVATGGQSTGWFFEYGTTTGYGSITPVQQATANGPVSGRTGPLTPNTTYHFRLVAINGNAISNGADHTFRTSSAVVSPGRLVLVGTRLMVKHGKAAASLSCQSQRNCTGSYSLSTRVKNGRKTVSVACTKRIAYSIPTGKAKVVSGTVTRACLALLKAARHHVIAAQLAAKPKTGQKAFTQSVKLQSPR